MKTLHVVCIILLCFMSSCSMSLVEDEIKPVKTDNYQQKRFSGGVLLEISDDSDAIPSTSTTSFTTQSNELGCLSISKTVSALSDDFVVRYKQVSEGASATSLWVEIPKESNSTLVEIKLPCTLPLTNYEIKIISLPQQSNSQLEVVSLMNSCTSCQ